MAVQAPQAPSQRLSYQTPSGYDVKHDSPASNAAATPLSQGWLEMQDPSGSGRTLYCNPSTGQTSWERPGVRTLPPGWIKATTPEGNDIFIHPETQRCTFQWPEQEAALPSQSAGGAAPAIARTITAPSSTSVQPKPRIVRSQTVPVQPPQATQTITARKPVPVLDPSSTIELLSDRNNTRVLSHKFASDLAQTTTAMKEVTISGASLATRQVKVVGQTLVSRKKLGKASKKLVVHTGALTVKTGRAFKGLVNEMVDAADKKGKYEPKHQRSVRPNVKAASQSSHQNTPVHGHQPRHPMTKNENPPNYSPATVSLSEKQPAPAPAPAPAIISRKMTARKPVGSQSVAVVNSDAPHIANGSNQSNPQDASSFNNNGGTFTGITERNSENEGTRGLPVSVETNVNPRVASARPHAPQRVHGAASQASSPAPLQRRPPQQAASQISSNAPTPVAAAPWVANAHQMQVQRLPKPSSLKTASANPVPQQGIMPPGSIPRPPSYTQATSEPLARPAPRPSSRPLVQPHLGPAARPPARPAANRPQQGRPPNHQMRPRPQHPGVTQNGVADTINSVTKLVHQFASAVPTGHGMDTSGANGASTSLPQYAASSLGSPDDQNQTSLTTDGGQGQGSANPVLAGLGSGSGQRASTQNMAVQRPVASSDQDQFADEGYGIDQGDDADDGQQVDDTLDADQSLDVDDTGEVDQSQDLDPTGDVDQSQYLDQTDGVDDVPYGDETLDVDQDQYVDETYDADQVEFNEETFEVDQTQYDEEVPYVDETVDFDEAGEMDQNQDVDIDVSYVEDDTAALSTYDDAVEDDVVENTVDEEVVYEEEDTVSVDAYEVDCEVDVEVDATEEDGDEDVDVDVEQDDSEVCW